MALNLIKKMKENIAKSGSNQRDVMYIAADAVKRVRFLQELDEGFEFQFHNNWEPKIYTLCKDPEDHECCDLCNQGIPLIEQFVWSVWDYDSNSVKLLVFKANGISPVPSLIEMYEEFGTIMDRDYKIKKVGKGMGSSFVVTPLDKMRFNNKKAKPHTELEVKEIFEKAFPYNENDDDEDETEEEEKKEVKKAKNKKSAKKAKKSPEEKLRDSLEDMELSELKEIAYELGMSKKEVKKLDEEELIDEFIDNYEVEDIQDIIDEMEYDEEDEDDE